MDKSRAKSIMKFEITLTKVAELDIYQSELERSDFQHQTIPKLFHDYFRYVQDCIN